MRIDRLTQLANYLENNVTDNQFDILDWEKCAVGHASIIFKDQGFNPCLTADWPYDEIDRFFEFQTGDYKATFSSENAGNRTDCIQRIRDLIQKQQLDISCKTQYDTFGDMRADDEQGPLINQKLEHQLEYC